MSRYTEKGFNWVHIEFEIENIDPSDYPDFVDAFATHGYYRDTGIELTADELEDINDNHADLIQELAFKKFIYGS